MGSQIVLWNVMSDCNGLAGPKDHEGSLKLQINITSLPSTMLIGKLGTRGLYGLEGVA